MAGSGTGGPCPRGYITIGCGCSAPHACLCGSIRQEPPPAGDPAAGDAGMILTPSVGVPGTVPPAPLPPILAPPAAVPLIPVPAVALLPIPRPPFLSHSGRRAAGVRKKGGGGGMEGRAPPVTIPAQESASWIRSVNEFETSMRLRAYGLDARRFRASCIVLGIFPPRSCCTSVICRVHYYAVGRPRLR